MLMIIRFGHFYFVLFYFFHFIFPLYSLLHSVPLFSISRPFNYSSTAASNLCSRRASEQLGRAPKPAPNLPFGASLGALNIAEALHLASISLRDVFH